MNPQAIENDLGAAFKFVEELQKRSFFGVVELHFAEGKIVRVKKQEVFLPKDLVRLTSE